MLSPRLPAQASYFVVVFVIHTSYKIACFGKGGGGDCRNAQKQVIIKAHRVSNFVQTLA